MRLYGQLASAVSPGRWMTDALIPLAPHDSRALRNAFGRFGTGVTVITIQSDLGPLGMTVNSFSSVSLDPPLVLWCAGHTSKRHDAFVKAEHFCIHILGADQEGVANHFATQGHDFSEFDWKDGPSGAPELTGCVAAFHCARYAVHPAGDHTLILGEVKQAAARPDDRKGLLFERGRFGSFAPKA